MKAFIGNQKIITDYNPGDRVLVSAKVPFGVGLFSARVNSVSFTDNKRVIYTVTSEDVPELFNNVEIGDEFHILKKM